MRSRHLEITAGISARDYAGEEGNDGIGVREGYTGVKHKFPYHIGYRFQPKKEGLVARIAWSPVMDKLFGWSNFKYISYNTGISIGYSFK